MFADAGINLVDDVLYVIVSQRNSYHISHVEEKRELWSSQLREMSGVDSIYCYIVVYLSLASR